LRNLIWQLRRQVGLAEDGTPFVAFADAEGKYRLHNSATCDLLQLAGVEDVGELQKLLRSSRGRIFECRRGFEWAHAEGLVAWAEARVVSLVEQFGQTAIDRGDVGRVIEVVESALVTVPEDERLYRLLMQAQARFGDRRGVERAMGRLLALASSEDMDPWALIEPETLQAYVEAGGRQGPAPSSGRPDGR
jgi:hypothetical protein